MKTIVSNHLFAVILLLAVALCGIGAGVQSAFAHDGENHSQSVETHVEVTTDAETARMLALIEVLQQLVALLAQQQEMQGTHVHDDSHSHDDTAHHEEDTLAITVELHNGDVHVHVEAPGEPFENFWLDDYTVEQETEIIAAIAAETGYSVAEVTAVVTFPSDDEHGEREHGGHTTDADMDLSGIHIMSDGTVMLGDGTVLSDATVNADGMIVLSNGTEVEPEMDMR